MKRLFVWMCPVVLMAADPATPGFSLASPDARVGDWRSSSPQPGIVAQIFRVERDAYQVNVLRAFDGGPETGLAMLRGPVGQGAVRLLGDGWQGELANGLVVLNGPEGRFVLEKTVRPSPTLGARPPAGAQVLFAGESFAGWAKKSGKNWLVAEGPPAWTLTADGAMEVVPGTDSIITNQSFGDGRLHLEFRTLGGPTNSGVYLQARYEVDLNESFGRRDGTPCGTLGNCSPVKPTFRATRAPLEWQTLQVDFRAPRFDSAGKKTAPARATVRLNGVTLYENEELHPPKGAAGRLGEAPVGPLLLQEHGAPLQFRNIWFLPAGTPLAAVPPLS